MEKKAPIVGGKLPLSRKPPQKKTKAEIKEMFRTSNRLNIPFPVVEWLDKEGLEPRWLDAQRHQKNGGYNKNFWQVVELPPELAGVDAKFGAPVDGTLRRGTVVLGARPKEFGEVHREELREKSVTMAGYAKQQAQELKRSAGKNAVIHEGYEDEE